MELHKKLRLTAEKPLWLINAPDDVLPLFDQFEIKQKPGKEKPIPQVVVFVYNRDELEHYLVKLNPWIGHETVCWYAYPKQTSGITSDLIKMESWDIVAKLGYRGQTSVAISEVWSSLRMTNAPPKKPSAYNIPPEQRNVPGIDFVKRTVQMPDDALKMVRKQKGMEEFFNKMAFTHKKEHVVAIVEAKKPETRQRRIEKMVEMLQQGMMAKPLTPKGGPSI